MAAFNITVNSTKNDMPTQDVLNIFLVVNFCQLVCSCVLFALLLCSLVIQDQLRSGASCLIFHQIITEGQMGCIHYFLYILVNYKYNLSTRKVYFSDDFCRHSYMAYMVTTAAGHLGIFNLAVNRYIALMHPLHYKKFITKKLLTMAIVMSWVFGILCHIYFYVGGDGGFVATKPFGNCGFAQQNLAFKLSTIFSTYTPLMAAAVVYVTLFVRMFLTHRTGNHQLLAANPDSTAAKRLARRFALTKILFVSSLVYCACFASIPVFQGFFPWIFFGNPMTRLWFRTVFFTGYVMTPVIFFVMNLEYRMGVVKLFQWMFVHGRRRNQTLPLNRDISRTTKTIESIERHSNHPTTKDQK